MNKITICSPSSGTINKVIQSDVIPAFDELVLKFFDVLSVDLLKNPSFKPYSDIIAFGFWIRRSRLMHFKSLFGDLKPSGLVFHIAPSNVDTLFLYSWVTSQLLGNKNIVRLSSKAPESIHLLLYQINALLDTPPFKSLQSLFCIIQYDHESTFITNELSRVCHRRVIWGGSETIALIQKSKIQKGAEDILFADKKSCAVIDAKKFLEIGNADFIGRRFFNDAYIFDQMACSSPQVIFWIGSAESISSAKAEFWNAVKTEIRAKQFTYPPISSVDKETIKQSLAIEKTGVICESSPVYCTRVALPKSELIPWDCGPGFGFFIEVSLDSFGEINTLLPDHIQTVVCLDPDGLEKHVHKAHRVVAFGQALEFHYVWDSINLFEVLSET